MSWDAMKLSKSSILQTRLGAQDWNPFFEQNEQCFSLQNHSVQFIYSFIYSHTRPIKMHTSWTTSVMTTDMSPPANVYRIEIQAEPLMAITRFTCNITRKLAPIIQKIIIWNEILYRMLICKLTLHNIWYHFGITDFHQHYDCALLCYESIAIDIGFSCHEYISFRFPVGDGG